MVTEHSAVCSEPRRCLFRVDAVGLVLRTSGWFVLVLSECEVVGGGNRNGIHAESWVGKLIVSSFTVQSGDTCLRSGFRMRTRE